MYNPTCNYKKEVAFYNQLSTLWQGYCSLSRRVPTNSFRLIVLACYYLQQLDWDFDVYELERKAKNSVKWSKISLKDPAISGTEMYRWTLSQKSILIRGWNNCRNNMELTWQLFVEYEETESSCRLSFFTFYSHGQSKLQFTQEYYKTTDELPLLRAIHYFNYTW